MKASELRIGNFYNQFGNITEVDLSTLKDLKDAPLDQLWCKPIPLIEEWLLKFGFKFKRQNKSHIHICEIKKNYEFYYNDATESYGFIETKLKYVHSLQNLFFALTGEELTIKD